MNGAPTAWPVVLQDEGVRLRPLRFRDQRAWHRLRAANREWLAPWEATNPEAVAPPRGYLSMVRQLNRTARRGLSLPFAIEVDGELAGQVSVGGLVWGSLRGCAVGYWVDRVVAGRGVAPTAVALVSDHCLFTLGLHRVEVNIRPENRASLRVVEKLGFRDEGIRERYLHIDGAWRDHRTFALTVEDVPAGLLTYWRTVRTS